MFTSDELIQSLKVSLIYCIFCYALQGSMGFLIRNIPDSTASKDIKFQTSNRIVSAVHAVVMFSLSAYYWLKINPTIVYIKGGRHENLCIDIMLGYLFYDIVQEIKQTCQADTLGHHIMGFLSHYTTRFADSDAAYFYTMVVYLAEASTPFLHSCWILHTFKMGSHPLFLPLSGMLLLSFFIFRVLQGGYILWHLATDSVGWDGKYILQYMNTVILVLFVALNYYWFIKLIQMATGLGKKKKAKQSD